MSTIRYHIYEPGATTPIIDPERSGELFTGVKWVSRWPKGFAGFTATVRRDIFKPWQVRPGYRIVAKDGPKPLYDGRLGTFKKSISNGQPKMEVTAHGWWKVLTERRIHKRWYDRNPISRFAWPAGAKGTTNQEATIVEKRDKDQVFKIRIRTDDENLTVANYYQEQYVAPSGNIYSVAYDYEGRTGQGFDIVLFNDALATVEDTANVSGALGFSGSVSHATAQFAGATGSFTLRIGPDQSAQYDQNDWLSLQNFEVRCAFAPGHSNTGTPVYSPDQLIEDVLLLVRGIELSTDISQIRGDTAALDNYVTEEPRTAADIIEELALFSDAGQNVYGGAFWDGERSSDGLPNLHFGIRDTSQIHWTLNTRDCQPDFQLEETDAELYNYVLVKFMDSDGVERYLTPVEDADLRDNTSIALYGERHSKVLDAGEVSQAQAKRMGQRYLAYHATPLDKGSFSIRGGIARRLRAGQVFHFADLNKTIFAREVSYDVDSDTATVVPDLPPDNSARV